LRLSFPGLKGGVVIRGFGGRRCAVADASGTFCFFGKHRWLFVPFVGTEIERRTEHLLDDARAERRRRDVGVRQAQGARA